MMIGIFYMQLFEKLNGRSIFLRLRYLYHIDHFHSLSADPSDLAECYLGLNVFTFHEFDHINLTT